MLDLGELPKRNLCAVRRGDDHLGERLRVGAVLRRIPDPDGKALAPFNRQSQDGFADGGRAAAERSTSIFKYCPLVTCSG
jgi:hypothetical protein